MIKIMDPPKHGYVGAILDENGQPIKVVCDVLEVVSYVMDLDTVPMATLTVTYARYDSTNEYYRAGPLTQHYITGEELAGIIDRDPEGITVSEIDKSTAKTGIPSAGIKPEDIVYMPVVPEGPAWRADYWAKRIRETVKRLEEQRLEQPPPVPSIFPAPTPSEPPAAPLPDV